MKLLWRITGFLDGRAGGGAGGRRALLLLCACALYGALQLPFTFNTGSNFEEVAALVTHTLRWEHARPQPAPATNEGGHLVAAPTPLLPVWGYETAGGRYHPIMVDGHIGAIVYYPTRWVVAVGGLFAGRLFALLAGIALVVAVWLVSNRLFAWPAAPIAAFFVATQPLVLTLFGWTHVEEHVMVLLPVLALFFALEHERTQARWCVPAAAIAAGLGAAGKNSAAWHVIAALLTLAIFRRRPRVTAKQWLLAGALFALPLVPQLAYACYQGRSGAMSERWQQITSHSLFDLSRLVFFYDIFRTNFAHAGTALAELSQGRIPPPASDLSSLLLLVTVLGAALVVPFVRGAGLSARMYGTGVLLLFLQYIALYHNDPGQFFLPVLPWVAMAVAVVGAGLSTVAGRLGGQRAWYGRAPLAAAAVALFSLNLIESKTLYQVLTNRTSSMFSLSAQEGLVHHLIENGVESPWVVTYSEAGVYDVLSLGRVRPHLAYPIFSESCTASTTREAPYRAAWELVLDRMQGAHEYLVLPSKPAMLEMSPCAGGPSVRAELESVVAARGRRLRRVAGFGPASEPAIELFEIEPR
jgi:hypothetical protein